MVERLSRCAFLNFSSDLLLAFLGLVLATSISDEIEIAQELLKPACQGLRGPCLTRGASLVASFYQGKRSLTHSRT